MSRYEAILSGERTGCAASLLRGVLWLASTGYGLGRTGHRALYGAGLCRRTRLALPVISVGNLTVGGVGKTPFVAWLARRLIQRGVRPVVLARGWGRAPGDPLNEEGRWLSREVAGLTVLQSPDRAGAARDFLREDACDVFVLDDGFQHEALARDLDLVLVDATRPFGHGHLLPRGLLRERVTALRRAGMVIVTRCELVATAAREELEQQLQRIAPEVPVGALRFEVAGVRCGTELRSAAVLREQRVVLLCGVAHPTAVRRSLELAGASVVDVLAHPDHHHYRRADLETAWQRARELEAELVTTAKDGVKLEALTADPPWVVEQALHLLEGEDELERRLSGCLGRRPDARPTGPGR